MYILKISNQAFIKISKNNEIIIISDYTKATQYPTIGEAMKAASKINGTLGTHLIKAIPL